MCDQCSTPEVQQQRRDLLTALGLDGTLVERLVEFGNNRIVPMGDGSNDPYTDTTPAGIVSLTVGQANVIKHALRMVADDMFQDAVQALGMSQMLGVPLEAALNVEGLADRAECVLGVEDAVNTAVQDSFVSEFTVEIPDEFVEADWM